MKEVINSTRRPLPYGFYTRKHYNTFLAIFLGLSALSIFVTILMYKHNVLNHPFLYIFVELLFLLIAFAFAHLFGNPLLKALRKFYKTCNFDKLRRSIGEMLKYKMHGETSKELILTMLRYMYFVNASEADSVFVLVLPPTKKYNKYLYSILKIRHLILTDKLEEATKEIDKVNPKLRSKDKEYIQLDLLLQIAKNKVSIGEIEKRIKTNSKYEYINVRNSYTLMRYFQYYSDYKKAKVYAKTVRDNGPKFYELADEADDILKFQPKDYKEIVRAYDTNAVYEKPVNIEDISIEDLAVEKDEPQGEQTTEQATEVQEEKTTGEEQVQEQVQEEVQEQNQEDVQEQVQEEIQEEAKEDSSEEQQIDTDNKEENGSNN